MIPVARHEEEVPAVWDQSIASTHRARALACATDKERSEYFKSHPYWTNLTPLFEHWSYGKCWYTEAKTRKHGGCFEVDHFRPKSRARDPWNGFREWPGYPWLAYEWRNFRLSVSTANKLGDDVDGNASGKGVYFPLRSATSPVATRENEIDLETDHVLLIDPCNPDEVSDISFAEDGRVTCTNCDDAFRAARVERTVNVYNLDHPGLVEARQEVWRACQRLLSEIKRYAALERLSEPGPMTDLLRSKRDELRLMFRDDQEFAGTARAFARTRDEQWVRVASQHAQTPEDKSSNALGWSSTRRRRPPVNPRRLTKLRCMRSDAPNSELCESSVRSS